MPEKRPQYRVREITLKELFSPTPIPGRGLYFPSGKRRRPVTLQGRQRTWRGRLPLHNKFLEQNRGRIRVFADIGCDIEEGAPTTIKAKQALGRESKVYAVDVIKQDEIDPDRLERVESNGIIPMMHWISKGPLPFQCNAIRWANVSYHMSQSDRRRALVNIWKSLPEGGLLLGSVEHRPIGSIDAIEHQFVLRKVIRREGGKEKSGWEEVILE